MARALPTGVTQTERGFRVFVRVRLGTGVYDLRSKTFPPTAPLTVMKAWREAQRVKARAEAPLAAPRGTFADDVDRYLRLVAAMPTLAWRTRDLAAWKAVFGSRRRSAITVNDIRAQLQEWRARGPVVRYVPRTKEWRELAQPLSASACNHRRTALLHLWTTLDGKAAPNPVRDVAPFHEPPPVPRARDLATVAAALATLKSPKQRARALVLLWTGIRGNSELSKMTKAHVDLERGLCHVPTAKGGTARIVPLNEAGVQAWKDFIKANAWGEYDKDALRLSIRRACARAGIADVRAYDLRHTIATSYLGAGADLADVQQMLGHTTPRMTRRYAPFDAGKLHAAGKLLHASVTPKPQDA
jgi:integrase